MRTFVYDNAAPDAGGCSAPRAHWLAGRLLSVYVPGFPGAHSQADSLDELHANLREVIAMLLEDGEPPLEAEFVGTQIILVA